MSTSVVASLIIFLITIVAGIVFAMRYFLTRNITQATSNLEKMSQSYQAKENEASKHLIEAEQKSSRILTKAKEEAEEIKTKSIEEIQEEKNRILRKAHLQGEQVVQQAEKTREFLAREMNQKIAKEAIQKACELIKEVIPDQIQKDTHSYQFKELIKSSLEELNKLHLPDKIKEVYITSAYRLTSDERNILENQLKKKIGSDIKIKEKTEPNLIAGFIITIGSIIIDGSLKNTIQKAAKKI
jgi:F0F1-type ATP synthase delta subunit